MARTVIDGDTGEDADLGPQTHCFIVRFDDGQFRQVLDYQAKLTRVARRKVSRADTMREIVAHVLPRRKRPKVLAGQIELFGKPLARNPLVAVEAQRVAGRAAERLLKQ